MLTHLKLRELESSGHSSVSADLECRRQRCDSHAGVAAINERHQMRIDTRDAGLFYATREWVQPALRLPLESVFAPNSLVGVDGPQVNDYRGAFRHWDLRYQCPIQAPDGFREG